jgi:hypothetical protein
LRASSKEKLMEQIKRPAGQGRAANETQNESPDLSARLRAIQARVSDSEDPSVDVEGFKALLPEGSYEAVYLGHQTALVFHTPKVFLRFRITQHGPYNGVEVFRAFRVRALKGRPAPNGGFTLHAGGELYSTLVRLLDVRNRADRVTLRPLRAMLFRIRLRTVTTDYRQRPLPEHNRYSTIDEIERGE